MTAPWSASTGVMTSPIIAPPSPPPIGAGFRSAPISSSVCPARVATSALTSLERVLELGVEGLKLHPLHIVRHTRLAIDWQRGDYQPLTLDDYVSICADLIERTPPAVTYHRLTGTASRDILLAPDWCSRKWAVLNAIEAELHRRDSRQGDRVDSPTHQKHVSTA